MKDSRTLGTTEAIEAPPEHHEVTAKSSLTPEDLKNGDTAWAASQQRVVVSDEDDRRIARRTDIYLLSLLSWIYFLQILDKSVIGYSAVFGLKTDAHLVGNQYSDVGSIGYYAQLVAQPLGAYLLVKVPIRIFMPVIVFCWGVSLCGMAASSNYGGLMASRFLLGFFEAACVPIFSMLTGAYYRRSEQPMRVATWYGTNGAATVVGSIIVYGLAHVHSPVLYSYQIIFLVTGLITVITAPFLYWRMDNSVAEARFLTPEDRLKAVERLRSNNTGITNNKFKKEQIFEMFLDIKTWGFMLMVICINTGTSVSNVFGPLILQGIAGFSAYETTLLNIPFGVMQILVIYLSSWMAYRFALKSAILAAFMVFVVIGAALLYVLPHDLAHQGPLLLAYYFLAFLFAANPINISWIVANTAGQTKKATILALYNASAAAGNIIGPQLFKSKDAPNYIPGLEAVLAIFCILIGLIGIQVLLLFYFNKRKEAQRVKVGKPAKINDLSMAKRFDNSTQVEDVTLGMRAFEDITDLENEEFVYIY